MTRTASPKTRRTATSKDKQPHLVIVESPAKARTIARFLGPTYQVKASVGHVRDLPKSKLGVDVDHDFAPQYLVPVAKRKVVRELKEAAAKASDVYLATDPDREGEAISWHLIEAAELQGKPVQRVEFHEITPEAIASAFAHPRPLNRRLVDAQQARRVLDRLVGYQLSPLLWQKVQRGLSAGRVQSVALRLLVDREREVRGFVPREYWSIEADLAVGGTNGTAFTAMLVADADTGEKIEIPSEAAARALVAELEPAQYQVQSLRRRETSRQPAPPFITSSMQQEASRKLGFTAPRTMALAQQLYEGLALGSQGAVGLITYLRTDSTHLAPSAQEEARRFIGQHFGAEYVPARPRSFVRKVKNAQEAHEAIRPTSVLRAPEQVTSFLETAQARLYELIWQRMVASQMAAARLEVTTLEVIAQAPSGRRYLFRASATRVLFPGFLALYSEGRDEEEERQTQERLPRLSSGTALTLTSLKPEQHFTQPPSRYTEATLIKALEEQGIGRPSTYATIVGTLLERDYAAREGRSLKPLPLGETVSDLLAEHFPDIVNVGFTARMEEDLDDIARGKKAWVPVLRDFYGPFEATLKRAQTGMKRVQVAEEPTDELCHECGRPMVIKRGRFGRFLACTGFPECKGTRPLLQKVGVACPQCGRDLVQRRGRRGRAFYGCSGYPECTFSVWARPLSQPCPNCGGLLTQQSARRAKCSQCGNTTAINESETTAATPAMAGVA